MRQQPMQNRGFTMVELAVVVAIVSILAAIAVPGYAQLTLRAKRSELPANLVGIRSAETAYFHEWDIYTACAATPEEMTHKQAVPFEVESDERSDWSLLGWVAEGRVYGQYSVAVSNDSLARTNFSAQAYADIDGDEITAAFLTSRDLEPSMITSSSTY